MDIETHKQEFHKITKKYNLDKPKIAQEIGIFLTSKTVNVKEFATKFKMSEEEAKIYLDFINAAIKFKEEYLDKNKK